MYSTTTNGQRAMFSFWMFLTLFFCQLTPQSGWAQAPNRFKHQAVFRSSSGELLDNQSIGIRISIRQGSANGTVVYSERHDAMSNDNGLVSIEIGGGTVLSGSMSGIQWSTASYFLQTEADVSGGTNYGPQTTTQMLSVPYALHAATADVPGVPGPQGPQGPQGPAGPQGPTGTFSPGTQPGELSYWNGNAWVAVPPGSYGQMLFFCNGIPKWGGCLPLVSTTAASAITSTGATTGGDVTADGGASVTARGVAYGTAQTPTTANSTTSDGTGTGVFTSTLTGLTASTLYYVRAYATNSVGTAYGNEVSFTTTAFACGTATVTDVDNNTYNTVQIGTQCWTQSNLKVGKYRNGDNISNITDNTDWSQTNTGAWCNYDNDAANDALYGKLYNWYSATDSRGLCPTGWHVPTDAEWTTLIDFLGGTSVAGGAMKSTATQPTPGGWTSPNTGATNSSGFTGLSGGYRDSEGRFGNLGIYGIWWSSSDAGSGFAWGRYILFASTDASRNYYGRRSGFSVRCVNDATSASVLPTVTTTAASAITVTGATTGGNVTADGGASVTARGVAYGTAQTPTTANSTTSDGTGTGVFTSTLTGLTASTLYYVRAYATNSVGTAYGSQVSFTTSAAAPSFTCGTSTVSDVDNNTYNTVQIGTQCWTQSNL
ncbi:MAG: hypothetical protein FJ344_07990, partial [Sphingomonadales bacterium]|nr:hypothetical protein [Sphingomonadales bacterium]